VSGELKSRGGCTWRADIRDDSNKSKETFTVAKETNGRCKSARTSIVQLSPRPKSEVCHEGPYITCSKFRLPARKALLDNTHSSGYQILSAAAKSKSLSRIFRIRQRPLEQLRSASPTRSLTFDHGPSEQSTAGSCKVAIDNEHFPGFSCLHQLVIHRLQHLIGHSLHFQGSQKSCE
jgi:hypothetical protein